MKFFPPDLVGEKPADPRCMVRRAANRAGLGPLLVDWIDRRIDDRGWLWLDQLDAAT